MWPGTQLTHAPMTDPDPLEEYMRVVRALNLCKLRMFAINAKQRKGGKPARGHRIDERHKEIAAEMESLREEGERWLLLLRERSRRSSRAADPQPE